MHRTIKAAVLCSISWKDYSLVVHIQIILPNYYIFGIIQLRFITKSVGFEDSLHVFLHASIHFLIVVLDCSKNFYQEYLVEKNSNHSVGDFWFFNLRYALTN